MSNSRRLKHFKDKYCLSIATPPRPDLEKTILECVDSYVQIAHKYILKEHTVKRDVKLIEKQATIYSTGTNQFNVRLDLHIHHYSRVLFDVNLFLAALNLSLKLPPASVTLASTNYKPSLFSPIKTHTSAFA